MCLKKNELEPISFSTDGVVGRNLSARETVRGGIVLLQVMQTPHSHLARRPVELELTRSEYVDLYRFLKERL